LDALGLTGFRKARGDEVPRIEVASGSQLRHLGIEQKSKTGDEAEDDEGDDEVEKVRVLLFVLHRNIFVKELP
jgi:hypothetical protein